MMKQLNKRLNTGLIIFLLLLWGCSGGVSGTGDGGSTDASVSDEAPSFASGNEAGSESISVLMTPRDIALDSAANRVLIVDSVRKAVIAIDLTNGQSSILSGRTVPNQSSALIAPKGIVIDEAGNRALVVDAGRQAVMAVDLVTGTRSVFSGGVIPNSNFPLDKPVGIALDSANNRVLVADAGLQAVIAINLSSGARTRLLDSP
jgi:DNA-binding beta-propeller fold protein YncE